MKTNSHPDEAKQQRLAKYRSEQVGKLQDAWHYAKLWTNQGESTFCGDRQYTGLSGLVKAFDGLHNNVIDLALNYSSDIPPEFSEIEENPIKSAHEVEDMDVLRSEAKRLLAMVEKRAYTLGIDARTGEKPE